MCAACKSDEQRLEEKVESYLSQMTLEEKTGIIHAQSKFSSAGVPRLGIPELWTDDGPHEWVAESGDFDILVGAASDDLRTSVRLTL